MTTTEAPRLELSPYCRLCWFPSSKPNITLSADGVCRACESAATRVQLPEIEWERRSAEFSDLILRAVRKGAPNFDVVVPVSGGKDSITQVVRANQHGARILAVSVDYGVKTNIGRSNLDVVPAIDDRVHLQVYRPPLGLHRRLIWLGLDEYGDPDLFSHTLLHAYPLHQAMALQVPLVVLGENSADVYGGSREIAQLQGMTRDWFEKYAVSGDHNVVSTAAGSGIDTSLMRFYDFPDDLEHSDTQTVFLSSYFPWDSEEHFRIARGRGFAGLEDAREGTFKTYVGIDEHINRIHQYLKLLKFGYGRTTDHACEEIRLGRLTREDARELILRHELSPPSLEAMEAVSNFLKVTPNKLAKAMERWRNQEIWHQVDANHFAIDGFLDLAPGPRVERLDSIFR